MTQKIILGFIGGAVIGALCVFAWNTYRDQPLDSAIPETTIPEDIDTSQTTTMTEKTLTNDTVDSTNGSSRITVSNQDAGTSVLVSAASLDADGWVVIHEERNGVIGNALGAARTDAGEHTNVIVPLLRATQAGLRYWVVLYGDNGDREFHLSDDFPFRESAGEPVISSFQAQ